MTWRERAAAILANEAGSEPAKPTKPPIIEVLQVLQVPPPVLSGEIEAGEARRLRTLAMLDANPGARYAVLTDMHADPEAVIVALAIRDRATCELRIPRAKWDGVLFLELLERHAGTIH